MRFLFLALLIITMPAVASEEKDLSVFCRDVVRHVPDSSIRFLPQKEGQGKRVIGADLNDQSGLFFGDDAQGSVIIPLNRDLGERGEATGFENNELLADLGILKVGKDGRVTKDGRDVTGAVVHACGNHADTKEVSGQ